MLWALETWISLSPSVYLMLLPSIWLCRIIHFTSCVKITQLTVFEKPVAESLPDEASGGGLSGKKSAKQWNTTYKANHVWEGITMELWSTKTRHRTHCAGCSQDPKVQFPVLFPGCRWKPEKWLRQSPLFLLTYVCSYVVFREKYF